LYVYYCYCYYFASSEYGSGGGLANNHKPDRPGVRVGDKSNVRSLTDAPPDAPSNTTNEVPTNTATDVPTTGISWDGSYFYCYYFTSMTNEAPTDTPTYTPTTGISCDGSSEYGGGGLANNHKPGASDSNRSNIKFRSPTDAPPGDAPTDKATDMPTTGISWDGSYFYCHYFASSEYGGSGLANNHRPGASDGDESNSSPAHQQTHHLMHPATRPTRCPPTRPSATVTASAAVPCVRLSAVTVLSKTGLLFPFGSLAPMPLSSLASLGATQQQSTHQQQAASTLTSISSYSSLLDAEAPLEIQPEARNADFRLLKKQLREAQKQVEAMTELVNTMKAQALQPHVQTVDGTLIMDASSLAAEHVDKIGGLLNIALRVNAACGQNLMNTCRQGFFCNYDNDAIDCEYCDNQRCTDRGLSAAGVASCTLSCKDNAQTRTGAHRRLTDQGSDNNGTNISSSNQGSDNNGTNMSGSNQGSDSNGTNMSSSNQGSDTFSPPSNWEQLKIRCESSSCDMTNGGCNIVLSDDFIMGSYTSPISFSGRMITLWGQGKVLDASGSGQFFIKGTFLQSGSAEVEQSLESGQFEVHDAVLQSGSADVSE
jgi:hypothetical protein